MRILHCKRGSAAVEAAIFLPIFLLFTVGITDLGAGMFVRTQINAATQSGAMFASIHAISTDPVCSAIVTAKVIDSGCLNAIKAVMNDATGKNDPIAPFCAGVVCSGEIVTSSGPTDPNCPAPSTGFCIKVSANSPYSPILSPAAPYSYAWAQPTMISSITHIRFQ